MERVFLILACLASAEEILVLVDSWDIKTTHSVYFDKIASRGNKITYKMSDSGVVKLDKYDEYLYSTVILICPSAEGKF